MKKSIKTLVLIIAISCSVCCSSSDVGDDYDSANSGNGSGCGTYNGHTLHLGPQGGCYYYNENGNKTYVDRDECHC